VGNREKETKDRNREGGKLRLSQDRGIIRAIFVTPLGWVGVAASEYGICRVILPNKDKREVEQELAEFPSAGDARGNPNHPQTPFFTGGGLEVHPFAKGGAGGAERILAKTLKLLKRYFSGARVSFDLPLDMRYYTAFQQSVWKATVEISHGETRSYAWIAKRIKNPKAARAVGQAMGANPVPIIVPCHRVISSAGTLGGFSTGVGMKKKLLELEKKKNINHRALRGKLKQHDSPS
jgi:O-6-methylguanine DNA methyltransferase